MLKCVVCKRTVESRCQEPDKCGGIQIMLRQPTLREKHKTEQFCCNCARNNGWGAYDEQACNQCMVRDGRMSLATAQAKWEEQTQATRMLKEMTAERTRSIDLQPARLFQPSADISKWDFGKVQTTLDEIDANENSKAERLVIHYTTMEAAPFIKTGGFRASEYGQGGGGVYFAKAYDDVGVKFERYGEKTFSKRYFEELNKELFGPNAASREPLPVMIVCGVRKDFLDPVPIDFTDPRFHGKDEEGNLVYFKLSKMKDLFDAHDDGHYYLPIKSVKVRQVFRIA